MSTIAPPPSAPADACTNCGSEEPWGQSSWCPACGFYPKLNTTVEVEAPPAEAMRGTGFEEEEATPMAELMAAVPQWGWILGGGVVGVIVLSIVERLVIADVIIPRGKLAILQCVLGLIVALVGQWTVYFQAMTASEKFGPFDILMKPLAIWELTLRELPRLAWRLWCVAWGVTAVLCGMVIIGGITYSAIFEDWGFKERAQANLMHAIVDQARAEREGGADNIEDALNDLVGEEELTEEEKNELAARGLEKIDCLIFGYTAQGDEPTDNFSIIVLATMIDERIKFVGTMSAHTISEGARADLNKRMHTLRRKRPFVPFTASAKWVKEAYWLKPVLMCELGFEGWTKQHKLREPVFVRLLGDVMMTQ